MSQYRERVLVIGTTQDYVEHIRRRMPARAVFLTDPDTIEKSGIYPKSDELIFPLRDKKAVVNRLKDFLNSQGVSLSGVACFDCESLLMASTIAECWGLPFPSTQSVLYSRNKYLCKKLWIKHRIPCPRVSRIRGLDDVSDFMQEIHGPIILKPLSGSGSELVFKCSDIEDAKDAYRRISSILETRAMDRMYCLDGESDQVKVICEEFIAGDEFSCDVCYDAGRVQILRIARKYMRDDAPTGTVMAYEIPANSLLGTQGVETIKSYLGGAIRALAMDRCLCMVDFIWHNNIPYFLELSPRPGGDCLPQLVEQSCGMDMLGITLDFAECRPLKIPLDNAWKHVVGIRFHADRSGRLESIRAHGLDQIPNLLEWKWIRHIGDRIQLPPEDYDSWLLGYGIFSPSAELEIKDQILGLVHNIEVGISQWAT